MILKWVLNDNMCLTTIDTLDVITVTTYLCVVTRSLIRTYYVFQIQNSDIVPCDMPLQLHRDGGLDWHALETAIKPETQCALIQRSCGYSWRKTLTIAEIERAIIIIKASVPCRFNKLCLRN